MATTGRDSRQEAAILDGGDGRIAFFARQRRVFCQARGIVGRIAARLPASSAHTQTAVDPHARLLLQVILLRVFLKCKNFSEH